MGRFLRFLSFFCIAACLFLTGCTEVKRLEEHDPTLKYTRAQYEAKLTGQDESVQAISSPRYRPPKQQIKKNII